MFNSKEAPNSHLRSTSQAEKIVGATVLLGGASLVFTLLYGSATAYESQSKAYIADRSDQVRSVLAGHIRPGEMEKIYEAVVVTTSAPTFAEKLEKDRAGVPVAVLEYPGAYLPNGAVTRGLGTVKPGTVIQNVYWTVGPRAGSPVQDYWGAFDCSKVDGVAWKPEFVGATDGKVCAISGDNLMNAKPQARR